MGVKTKYISLLSLVVDAAMAVLLIIGLCVNWVKPGKTTPEGYKSFKINSYGDLSLRHTCLANHEAFNEACLTYQGSVVVIVLCSTSLLTITANTAISGLRCLIGDRIEKREGQKKANAYIITVSTVHILLFAQLFICVIAYITGSHRIRHDLGYVYGPGWIMLLLVMIISLAFSLVLFFIQCLLSSLKSIITLFTQITMFLLPTGTVLILIGLCTSFFTSFNHRVNALKIKEVIGRSGTSTNLKDYCDYAGNDSSEMATAEHLCSLYKSSAALIAFSVAGFLSSFTISGRFLDSLKKVIAIVLTFVFFFVGFIQYTIVSLDVMDDFDFHYGLGWVFYLVGFILTSVGLLLNGIDIALFGRGKNRKVHNDDIEGDDDVEEEKAKDNNDKGKEEKNVGNEEKKKKKKKKKEKIEEEEKEVKEEKKEEEEEEKNEN